MSLVRDIDVDNISEGECEGGGEVVCDKVNGSWVSGDGMEEMEGVEGGKRESGDVVRCEGGERWKGEGGQEMNSEVVPREEAKMDVKQEVEEEEDVPCSPMCGKIHIPSVCVCVCGERVCAHPQLQISPCSILVWCSC